MGQQWHRRWKHDARLLTLCCMHACMPPHTHAHCYVHAGALVWSRATRGYIDATPVVYDGKPVPLAVCLASCLVGLPSARGDCGRPTCTNHPILGKCRTCCLDVVRNSMHLICHCCTQGHINVAHGMRVCTCVCVHVVVLPVFVCRHGFHWKLRQGSMGDGRGNRCSCLGLHARER